MSEENVEIVRRSFQAWNSRDPVEIARFYKEDMKWQSAMADVFGETIGGHEAIKQEMARWDKEWSATRFEIDELIDLDDTRVLSLHRVIATGRGSGVKVVRTLSGVYELHDGKIVKMRIYLDRAEALEAAGLSE